MVVTQVPKSIYKLSKAAYSLEIIRSTLLSFQFGACQITDADDYWLVDLSVMKESIPKDLFFRRIDEYSLRASLEKRFASERDAIISLAFQQE